MSVILIGYRGSGKTTIGKRLADRLWWKFVDTDELVIKAAGKTIKDIFEQAGENEFRDLEVGAVRQACAMEEHAISVGGGAVVREENRQALVAAKEAKHKIIYLRCDPAVLLKRIQADPETQSTRPPLTHLGGSIDEINKLLADREPLYRQMMHVELDVTNLSPDEAVVWITRMM
jgi:shikimate kinase